MRKAFLLSLLGIAVVLLSILPLPTIAQGGLDKLTLWNSGETQLRGANLYQRIVYPADGPDFLGNGHIGPPYTQADFNELASLGANYVNLSVPGIYTISPPYVLDTAAQTNLDNLVAMAQQANLFVVISFRTGPGRSDFTFYPDGAGDWYPASYLIQDVWTSQAAQDAWVAMWRATASRYKNNPVVVGYDLMVEPNSNAILNIYDPDEFFDNYTQTTYDWNRFYPTLVTAIRKTVTNMPNDPDTPILIAGNSWGSVYWLQYTDISSDPRVVYVVHNYEPFNYSNQDYSAGGMLSYPGVFDADDNGHNDTVNKAWQDNLYSDTVDDWRTTYPTLPLAVTEIGVTRWSPGAHTYLADEFSLLEDRGLNHAIWMYHGNWQPFRDIDSAFDFMAGPNPANKHNVATSALIQAIKNDWAQNTIRPFFVSPPNAAPARNYFTDPSITLTWMPVSWATGYWLQVSENSTFTDLVEDQYPLSASLSSLDVTPGHDGTFYWRIRARRADGVTWGNWAASDSFVVKTAG